jgi:hypothetical protein
MRRLRGGSRVAHVAAPAAALPPHDAGGSGAHTHLAHRARTRT